MRINFNKKYGETIEHTASGFNLDDVADELKIEKENIVKAIIMEYKDKEPIVCIIRSVDRLITKNIKQITGFKFSFMKEENLSKYNVTAGAIPPFIGFNMNFTTYIDDKLKETESYFGSGGSNYNACKFKVLDYVKLGALVENLTS